MDEYRCPRCRSYQIDRSVTAFAEVSIVNMNCRGCKLYEERRSDSADYAAWAERWRGRPQLPVYDYFDHLIDVD